MSHGCGGLNLCLLWIIIPGLPLALLSGRPCITYTTQLQLRWLLRLASVSQIAAGIHYFACGFFASDKNISGSEQASESWRIPRTYSLQLGGRFLNPMANSWTRVDHIVTMLRHYLLPVRLGGITTAFGSSGSKNGSLHERNQQVRPPFIRRARIMLFQNFVIIHCIFVLACLAGLVLTVLRAFPDARLVAAYPLSQWWSDDRVDVFSRPAITTRERLLYLLTRIGWPPLLWYSNCVGMWVPIQYTLFPPTAQSNEQLLVMNEKTGVLYPRVIPSEKTWSMRFGRLRDHSVVLASAYSCFTFVMSWAV